MPIDTRQPREIRRDIRNGKLTGITAGGGQNHLHANLAGVAEGVGHAILLFCPRKPPPRPRLSGGVPESARSPGAHGAPIHIGDPAAIGIRDLATPDWGDPQAFGPGDVPVFWACGVTPQAVALASKPPFMITHSPGHMFITDLPNSALAAL